MPPYDPSDNRRHPVPGRRPLVPPPVGLGTELAVPVDIVRVGASVHLDVGSKSATVTAAVELAVEGYAGLPVFDLRQEVSAVRWDGRALAPEAVAPRDIGAGDGASVRVVQAQADAGSRHVLELEYGLEAPSSPGALPVAWGDGGVTWDFWMSDLEPGRYLEMWLPANLCHDQFALELEVEVAGTGRPHVLLANGSVGQREPGFAWTVRYPANFTSLSPLLVLVPADEVQLGSSVVDDGGPPLRVDAASLTGAGADLGDVLDDCVAWHRYFSTRYGTWAHGDRFLAVIWGLARGMEYDGATTSSEPALEHEIFHSWFGRGVKPARPCDGWIDEAMASWATASSRAATGRASAEPLGLDDDPVVLCPPNPWSRYTPREAYAAGSRLLSGVAHLMGGAPRMRAALADWHQGWAGGAGTTEELAVHLGRWCDRDLSPWWDRYVYGRG